jgi:uncharacterized protein (TIGR02466 family)
MLEKIDVFKETLYLKNKSEWLNDLNKFSDSYIEKEKESNKKYNDIGIVNHSTSLINDYNFKEFIEYINKNAFEILNEQGYDLNEYFLATTELWVQEFSNKGGSHHTPHVHWNGHISGFYFLKCSEKTSYPIFTDPKPGKIMNLLPEKNKNLITNASEKVHLTVKPGIFVFFNSYLTHEFILDQGTDPFRFIHFNIRAFPKEILNLNK